MRLSKPFGSRALSRLYHVKSGCQDTVLQPPPLGRRLNRHPTHEQQAKAKAAKASDHDMLNKADQDCWRGQMLLNSPEHLLSNDDQRLLPLSFPALPTSKQHENPKKPPK